MSHPSLDQLQRFLAEQLPAGESKCVEEHVNGCDGCLEQLESAQRGADTGWLADLLLQAPQDLPTASSPRSEAPEGPAAWPGFAGYDLLARVGGGGMGEIYKARHRLTGRVVALKTLSRLGLPDGPRDPELLARFRREVQAVSRLQHPNIVSIYEVGEHQGIPFFTMEWVEGGNLAQRLNGTPLPGRPAAHLLLTLARTVHHLHEAGIVHRDLKPANILLASGGRKPPESAADSGGYTSPPLAGTVLKLADFGVARLLDRTTLLTRSEQSLGTPEYMAPEQVAEAGSGQPVGPAADIYALGVLLYELLVGRPPFKAAGPLETLQQVRAHQPVAPSRLQPGCPRDLETICLKCLEKEPRHRYASAAALADDLEAFLAGEPITARPVRRLRRLGRWVRRHPQQVVLAILCTASLALLWLLSHSLRTLERAHAGRARDLAQAVDSQLNHIKHAVRLTARQEPLRRLLARLPADRGGVSRALQTFLDANKRDFNKWFTWSGTDPLLNLFVLDPDGTLVVDSYPGSRAVGRNFKDRHYARLLVEPGGDDGQVSVSRVYFSQQDALYKFSVVTAVRDGDRLLGLLGASVPVDARLVSLDMRQQTPGALVAAAMDWTYTSEREVPARRRHSYLAVLDAGYARPGRAPRWLTGTERAALRQLDRSPSFRQGRSGTLPGDEAHYARVGDTPFVVVVRQTSDWPLHRLARHARTYAPAVAGGLLLLALLVWQGRRRVAESKRPTPLSLVKLFGRGLWRIVRAPLTLRRRRPQRPQEPVPATEAKAAGTGRKPFFRWGNPIVVFGALAIIPIAGMITSVAEQRNRSPFPPPPSPVIAVHSALNAEHAVLVLAEGASATCPVFLDTQPFDPQDVFLSAQVIEHARGGSLGVGVTPTRIEKGPGRVDRFEVSVRALKGTGHFTLRVTASDQRGRQAETFIKVRVEKAPLESP